MQSSVDCSDILLENTAGILRIKMDRPEKKNALTPQMYLTMAKAIRGANNDDSVRVILLEGSEASFTSGNDLKSFSSDNSEEKPAIQFIKAINEIEKPLIAAVSGLAVGIGTTMLFHCDLVYAGQGTRFRMPFVNLGVCPEAGSSLLLPRLVGHQRASELLLLGEFFSVEYAKEFGLVNAITPVKELEEYALEQAKKIAAQPPESIRVTKALIKKERKGIVSETILEESKLFSERLGSPESAEAIAAFYRRKK